MSGEYLSVDRTLRRVKQSRPSVESVAMDVPSPPPAPFPLVAYADGLVETLRRLVPQALAEWDEESIHQARVATRRLKAAVDLFCPVTSDERRKPFARIGRRLRRRLGPLPDSDVMIGHLGALARNRTHAQAATRLSQRLRAGRDVARATLREKSVQNKVLETLDPSADLHVGRAMLREKSRPTKVRAKFDTWADLRGEIAEAVEAVDSLLVASIHAQLETFVEHAGRVAGAPVANLDVHELRIAGKALR